MPEQVIVIGTFRMSERSEACQACGVLSVGLYVRRNQVGEGWWLCGECGHCHEVKECQK